MTQTHYPGFDVMNEIEAWDPHTQSVVSQRLERTPRHQFLSPDEVATLRTVLGHLLYEDRGEILGYIVSHYDQRLGSKVGESQRREQVPKEADLVRWGLAAFEAMAHHRHGKPFTQCDVQQQFDLVSQLQRGNWETAQIPEYSLLPQKELFKKLLSLAVEAYASHPAVWSEMGYAGPAYPRGYYRIERGVTDPWEPTRDIDGGTGE